MIPYFRLSKNKNNFDALEKVYNNNNWVVGDETDELEELLKRFFNRKHVVFTSNGYSALFLSIKCIGIKSERIILPAVSTCFAISNAIISTGNIPVFCDVNLKDGNCDKDSVQKIVNDQNVKYIISPNHAGNVSAISAFKQMGLTVIEDACQSFLSSCEIESNADIQVFSFYPTKGINGIDGGVIATNIDEVALKARKLTYYNDQEVFERDERYNFRFLNICAAMALASLKQKDKIVHFLNGVKSTYHNILKGSNKFSILENKESRILQRYVVSVLDEEAKFILKERFKNNQIQLNGFFIWICPQMERSSFMNAKKLVESCYCVPYYEDLNAEEIIRIESVLKNVIEESNN